MSVNMLIPARHQRLLGWLSAGSAVAGVLSLPVYTLFADALAPSPLFPLPPAGWRLPGIPWLVAAFLAAEIIALATGIESRSTSPGRLGLYGAVSALSFCVVWAVSAAFGAPF